MPDFDVICVEGLNLWRNSSAEINDELFKGFREGNTEGKLNEVLAGYSLRPLDFIVSYLYIPPVDTFLVSHSL